MPQFLGCSSPGAVSREHPYLRLLLSVVNGPVYFDEERQGRATDVIRAIYNWSAIAPLSLSKQRQALSISSSTPSTKARSSYGPSHQYKSDIKCCGDPMGVNSLQMVHLEVFQTRLI
jgi:hypothetical protein